MRTTTVILFAVILSTHLFPACENAAGVKSEANTAEISEPGDKKRKKEKEEKTENINAVSVKVLQRWDMPEILTEISDIENIDDHSFACIQDESGIIFIYNLDNNKIERQVPFAGKGDYEGITLAGNVAYVVNSNGTLYEVNDIKSDKPSVKEYKTFFTGKDEVEALCFDKQNNRLLLAFKAAEGNGNTKGVYAFDLKSKQLQNNPVYTIKVEGGSAENANSKKKKAAIKPSAIAVNPMNGDMYLLEGTNPKLLIADKDGKMKSLMELSSKVFPQPEGITFNSAGDMFICNEGKKGKGNILKVKL